MCAACTGQIPLMDLLLTNGAKIELTNEVGDTALMVVAKENQPAALAWLIQHGAKVNARGPHGHTALIYAAYNGRLKSLKLLLAAGADPSATATDSSNPDSSNRYGAIDVAAQQGHLEAVALIRAAQKASVRL
jgi:ankyrin repeat protein